VLLSLGRKESGAETNLAALVFTEARCFGESLGDSPALPLPASTSTCFAARRRRRSSSNKAIRSKNSLLAAARGAGGLRLRLLLPDWLLGRLDADALLRSQLWVPLLAVLLLLLSDWLPALPGVLGVRGDG
jgi:hypothetical protein